MNVYDSIVEAAQELPATERGQLYAAVLEYLYYRREPEFAMRPAPRAVYIAMRPVLSNQVSRQEAGRKGGKQSPGRAEADGQAKAKQTTKQKASKSQADHQAKAEQSPSKAEAEAQANAKQNASEQEQEQEYKEEPPDGGKKKSPPPSLEEVAAYIDERGIGAYVTAEEFCGYYGSQGWVKSNGKPIVNWKLALVGWADRERRRRPEGGGADYGEWGF